MFKYCYSNDNHLNIRMLYKNHVSKHKGCCWSMFETQSIHFNNIFTYRFYFARRKKKIRTHLLKIANLRSNYIEWRFQNMKCVCIMNVLWMLKFPSRIFVFLIDAIYMYFVNVFMIIKRNVIYRHVHLMKLDFVVCRFSINGSFKLVFFLVFDLCALYYRFEFLISVLS